MSRKRMLIYPYSGAVEPFVKYAGLMEDYEIGSLVSPKGWGECGEVLQETGEKLPIEYDFTGALKRNDAVWFAEDGKHALPRPTLERKLKEALESGKKIIYSRKEEAGDILPEGCFLKEKKSQYTIDHPYLNRILPSRVPIVAVIGNYKDTDKMWVQLALRYEFMKRGYRVSSIFSSSGGELAGGHSYPGFMRDPELSVTQKILNYNQLVEIIAYEENPDLMIIGAPGGVIPYSEQIHNDFGIDAFEIFNAVTSDFAILCSLYSPMLQETITDQIKLIQNRFSIGIDIVHVSPSLWDRYDDIGNTIGGATIRLEEEFLYNRLPGLDKELLWNLRKSENIRRCVNQIIDKLS